MDVYIYQSLDGGEIQVENGVVTTGDSLASAVYLSMFNGFGWWGGGESQTEKLLSSGVPLTSSTIKRLEDTAQADLSWMTEDGAATRIRVSGSIIGVNKARLAVDIEGREPLEYVLNWKESL